MNTEGPTCAQSHNLLPTSHTRVVLPGQDHACFTFLNETVGVFLSVACVLQVSGVLLDVRGQQALCGPAHEQPGGCSYLCQVLQAAGVDTAVIRELFQLQSHLLSLPSPPCCRHPPATQGWCSTQQVYPLVEQCLLVRTCSTERCNGACALLAFQPHPPCGCVSVHLDQGSQTKAAFQAIRRVDGHAI